MGTQMLLGHMCSHQTSFQEGSRQTKATHPDALDLLELHTLGISLDYLRWVMCPRFAVFPPLASS